ncbi:hypothetical protein AgCh_027540 [Apium graveolens]
MDNDTKDVNTSSTGKKYNIPAKHDVIKDGKLRHPADAEAWKSLDARYPDFTVENQNVRLGLAVDGFSPYRTMGLTHNTLPVILVNYNLPPWLIMKPEDIILSTLIPGPVYLEIAELLRGNKNNFGKQMKQKKTSDCPWKKKSIFFELPYLSGHLIWHNLHVLHIEKNVCDKILRTLLNISGKSKDNLNAHFDMQEMGIRKVLHPVLSADNKYYEISAATFDMTKKEKENFCSMLLNARLPYGYASNICRCVQMSERNIHGYKSHDAHFILQYLLQFVVIKTLDPEVAIPLIRLGSFFRGICGKFIDLEDVPKLQEEIIEILCQCKIIFPPTFFDIMVHLPIHLCEEVELGGLDGGLFLSQVHHKGQFLKTKYLGGSCTKIPTAMEDDKFSFSVIMEHVMEDCKYNEIGGLYVKKAEGGWIIISNDAEANELVKGSVDGAYLDLYIDTVIDKAIEPTKQMQPHVLVVEKSGLREKVAVVQENAEKKKPADGMLVVEGEGQHTTKKATKKIKQNNAKANAEKAIHSKIDLMGGKEEKRAAENQRYLEETRLKKLDGSLIYEKSKKAKKSLEECWAEYDREYTPGHYNLENSENEEVPTAHKLQKVQKVKAVIKPSTRLTRSQILNNVATTYEVIQQELQKGEG